MLWCLQDSDLKNLLLAFAKHYNVYAPIDVSIPVADGKHVKRTIFSKVKSGLDLRNLNLETLPEIPVKHLFYPPVEVLFSIKKSKNVELVEEMPSIEKTLIFGLRKCDLNAIKRQDLLFSTHNDVWYLHRRELTTLIGIHCFEPLNSYCFCNSQELEDFGDLMLYELSNATKHWFFKAAEQLCKENESFANSNFNDLKINLKSKLYIVEICSEKGFELLSNFKKFFVKKHVSKMLGLNVSDLELLEVVKRLTPKTRVLKHSKAINALTPSDWASVSEQCLSCGICTCTCPTCYCFEIFDKEVKTLKGFETLRLRTWSSCQLQEFTRIANDFVFRSEKWERFKHRVMHQNIYFKQRYGKQLCTGCARCIVNCPVHIDWVGFINKKNLQGLGE
ncbi:4Fe-4S dicluster domain-containing protein [Candidatus Woesearchaeota archaeon]|nr:4Fe-4S dicluster domain-containing protein [Candidatus Woesearchaeota archaeon]